MLPKMVDVLELPEVKKLANECRPKIVICGGSAYPTKIEFSDFREIADSIGTALWGDIASSEWAHCWRCSPFSFSINCDAVMPQAQLINHSEDLDANHYDGYRL